MLTIKNINIYNIKINIIRIVIKIFLYYMYFIL
jgi:hypothetical protein